MAVNENEQDRLAAAHAAKAAELADEQGLLFTDDVSPLPSDTGYRGPTACNAAGITYRQLDYWARTGLVEPTVRGATGSGSQRLYSFRDILILKVVKRLLDAGISLQQIRTAVQHLRERGTDDLTRVTLMSDGASVYECTTNDEVIDLLQGGQGVFGIAIGGVWREIEGTLAELPSERAAEEAPSPVTSSPLAAPHARSAEPTTARTTTGPELTLRARRASLSPDAGASPGERRHAAACRCPASIARGRSCPARVATRNPDKNASPAPLVSTTSSIGRTGTCSSSPAGDGERAARTRGCRRPGRCRRRHASA